jgi:D-amino-acid oxidase
MPQPIAPSTGIQDIIVIGAGVIGLTTANLLRQRFSTHTTTIIIVASEFPPSSSIQSVSSRGTSTTNPSANYASMWAGAHYRPIPHLSPSHPSFDKLDDKQRAFHLQLANEHRLAVRTADVMKRLAKDKPESGVQIVPAAEYLEAPPVENLSLKTGDMYANSDDKFRVMKQNELDAINVKTDEGKGLVKWACEYETYVVNVHIYCQYLLRKFLDNGGKIVKRRLVKMSDALDGLTSATLRRPPVMVNCSGVGLTPDADPKVKIIRGQTVLVRNKFDRTITRQCADGTWSFLIPRPLGGGTIVGGTKQVGDQEDKPRSAERTKLLDSAVKYFPDFVNNVDEFQVVMDNVGRRPWRQGGMKMEIEHLGHTHEQRDAKIVHGYGAGGRGYEISHGAAEMIADLVEQCITTDAK